MDTGGINGDGELLMLPHTDPCTDPSTEPILDPMCELMVEPWWKSMPGLFMSLDMGDMIRLPG